MAKRLNVVVERCEDCSHSYCELGIAMVCRHPETWMKGLGKTYWRQIPSWCPLPDDGSEENEATK